MDKVFRAVKKERISCILKPKAGYILRRNTLLKQRQKGRDEKKEDVSSYSITLGNEKTPDLERGITLWRTRSGRAYGPVVRQTA